jgi:calcineurin-like phosphoesterase family protein
VKKPIHELDVEWGDKSQRLVLCHFPMLVWNRAHHGAIHLHGHSHGNLRFPNPSARIMDVGVDANEALMPVSLSRVMEHMIGADHKPFDQHGTL